MRTNRRITIAAVITGIAAALTAGLMAAPNATAAASSEATASTAASVAPTAAVRWRTLGTLNRPLLPIRHRFTVPRTCSLVQVEIAGWPADPRNRSVDVMLQDVSGAKPRLLDATVIVPGDIEGIVAARKVAGRSLRLVATTVDPSPGSAYGTGNVTIRGRCR